MNINIPEIIKEHHQNMIDKGFYDCPICKGKGEYKINQKNFPGSNPWAVCEYCKGTKIDPNKNIGESQMLIVSELSEALEAHRNNRFADWGDGGLNNLDNIKAGGVRLHFWLQDFESDIKDTFEDEISDVFLRLFDLCGYLEIELKYRCFPHNRAWGNIGSDLFYLSCKLPPDTGYEDKIEVTSYDLIFSLLLDFCNHHNIPIEKHIKAKMEYNKTRPHKHGKEY